MSSISDDSLISYQNIDDSFILMNYFLSNTCADGLIIMNQNIRSLRENFDLFLIHLNSLDKLPEIIILSEIWIETAELGRYMIDGYNQFSKCNENYRAGGVLVFISQRFSAIENDVTMTTADVINVKVNVGSDVEITFIVLYRLHAYSVIDFLSELNGVFACVRDNNVVFAGDINICTLKHSINTFEYRSLLASHGFYELISKPTRVFGNSSSCLDHINVRSKHDVFLFDSDVVSSGRSDHDISICSIKLKDHSTDKLNNHSVNNKINRKKLNYELLKNNLRSVDWSSVYSEGDVNKAFNIFLDVLNDNIDKATELLECKNNYKHTILKPWMTQSLCERQRYRNKMYKKVKKRIGDLRFQNYFKRYCDRLKRDMDYRKEQYYMNLFSVNKNDIKKQWKTINEILGKKSKNNKIIKIKAGVNPSVILEDENKIAEEFNSFFVSVSDQLKLKLDPPDDEINKEYRTLFKLKRVMNSFYFFETTVSEVEMIINSLDSKKSSGFDRISASIIKEISSIISPILSYLINFSFINGIFPESLKVAVVIPLFKKGDICDLNNYRPISLLSVFAKIFEKAIKKRCIDFLKINGFFSEKQFGFLEGKSTEDALLNFCADLYQGFNNKLSVGGLFIDITKAFDTVDHSLLLNVMWFAGFRGFAWNFFKSYLNNRVQCVKINNDVFSSFKPINCGVPQGSVLGPILFLIFINSLSSGPFRGSLTSFADDTALCYNSKSALELQKDVQYDLQLLKLWFSFNKLSLSNKTKFIHFSLKDKISCIKPLYYKCNICLKSDIAILYDLNCHSCMLIEQVDKIKYLGLFIDKNCNWNEHINSINKYMLSAIRTFYYLKNICHVNVLRLIYFSIIESKLQYGITCWGGIYFTNINTLLVAQKKIIRIMARVPRTEHAMVFFKQFHILPLRYLYVFRVLRIFFIRGGNVQSNARVYSSRLRFQNKVILLKANVEAFRRFFTFCALKFYNYLPFHVSSSLNLRIFLKELKSWLFSLEDVEFLFR